MRKYRVVTATDEKMRTYCYRIFTRYGDKVEIAVFEQEMRDRLGFVPPIVLDEGSTELKRFRDAGSILLPQDDKFIYRK